MVPLTMNDLTIGIIGGKGQMGRFLQRMFEEDKLTVLISDLDTQLSNKELARRSDLVIVSVPIDRTLNVIAEVIPEMTSDKLFMDVTSIKIEPVKKMLESKADVLGMHPMFDPSTPSIENQRIVLTPARDRNNWQRKIEAYFQKKQLKIKVTTPEEHDRMMSLIQVLNHFNTIMLGVTMSKLGFNINETLEFTSPIYRMELGLVARLFSQSPSLYGSILIENSQTFQILQEHRRTIDQLSKLVLNKDLEGFIQLFKDTAHYFDDFKSNAVIESDYLMSKLATFNRKTLDTK